MYEKLTYEYIMKRALDRITAKIDKRQGSVIWDALAPACAELAQMYIELDHILRITFAETSFGEWLDKRCSEMGIYRKQATPAVRLGIFYTGSGQNRQPFDVPVSSRFNLETLNYVVTEKLETGRFKLACEEIGITGNQLFGRLIPMETVKGLTHAELADILVPGEDAEKDGHLYARYEEAVNTTPFGGNIADYKLKVRALDGVEDCKVFPVRRGGGTVDVTIIDAIFAPPSDVLVADVQEKLDPEPFHQLGYGLAPIGHYVTVYGVEGFEVNIETDLQLKNNVTLGQVENEIKESVKDYFIELAKSWASEDNLIVRISQIESRIVSVAGVLDVIGTTLNGSTANIMLGGEQIPIFGEVVLHAG